METILRQPIVGQDEAVEAISRAIRRADTGIRDPSKLPVHRPSWPMH